jgi:CheY-like chemotaxis protein
MPHRILIVDDNDAFRGMLNTVLSLRGYQTLPARSAAEGLKLAAEHPVDAALVDVEMPEMDGLEFCRQLRAREQGTGREVPIWIMTGGLRVGVNRKAAAFGALLVMRKPLNVEEVCTQFENEFHARATGQARTAPAAPPPVTSGGSAESLGRL